MKRRLIYSLVTVLLAANLILGERVYLSSAHAEEQKDSEYANIELFEQVLNKIRTEYVNGTNMTYHDLVYSGIKGMVSSLDPHSE
ncbi:MAG TPA: carboxyl-terminal protease, partial [Verrucomicrobiae bacterium]|nr:carboxyl-terminal protease [Verrucomicrobiae bacterium]